MDHVRFARAALELGHAAAEGDPVLASTLEMLDRHVGAEVLSVAHVDARDGQSGQFVMRGASQLSAAEVDEWLRLIPTHPYGMWLLAAPLGSSRLTDVVSMREFRNLEIYRTLLRPQGYEYQATMLLDRRASLISNVSLWRHDRDFSDREVEALDIVRRLLVTGLEGYAARQRARMWAEAAQEGDPGAALAVLPAQSISGSTGLTPRQMQVASLVAQGLTNEQIARRLGVSPRTVRKHLEGVFAVSGCRGRTAVAIWWREGGRKAT